MLSDVNTIAASAYLLSCHGHWKFNVFQHIPRIVSNLQTRDLLYTLPNSILSNLQKWISTSWRCKNSSTSWMQSGYPCLLTTTSHQKISHMRQFLNGMELGIKKTSQYLLGVVTQSIQGGSPPQHPIFSLPIQCMRALLEFCMYTQFKSHNNVTLSYMENALHYFDTFKDVFLLGRTSKNAKVKASTLITELMKKRKVDEKTNAYTWTSSKKWREINPWRDYICH